MPVTTCIQCGKGFYVKPSHLSKGWGKFCSIKCRTINQLRGRNFICETCGKEVYRAPLAISRSKSGKYFCSKLCQTIWRNTKVFINENHPSWKTGESAYRKILKASKQPEICSLCKTEDKRILMVHHFDKDRHNNRVDNLIWLCNNCHYLVHHHKEEEQKLKQILRK